MRSYGFEEFKREVLSALSEPATPEPGMPLRADAPGKAQGQGGLGIYVNYDRVDRQAAIEVRDAFAAFGVDAMLSPQPQPQETPEQIRRAQQEHLEGCDAVVIVHGESPGSWVLSQYGFARRILAPRRSGIWAALLQVSPSTDAELIRGPNLVHLDCRRGLDQGTLSRFVRTLRGAAHA